MPWSSQPYRLLQAERYGLDLDIAGRQFAARRTISFVRVPEIRPRSQSQIVITSRSLLLLDRFALPLAQTVTQTTGGNSSPKFIEAAHRHFQRAAIRHKVGCFLQACF